MFSGNLIGRQILGRSQVPDEDHGGPCHLPTPRCSHEIQVGSELQRGPPGHLSRGCLEVRCRFPDVVALDEAGAIPPGLQSVPLELVGDPLGRHVQSGARIGPTHHGVVSDDPHFLQKIRLGDGGHCLFHGDSSLTGEEARGSEKCQNS